MVISFMVKEAREQLETKGFVYTLRPQYRNTGINWYNHFRGDTKKGDVMIEFIGYYGYTELLRGFTDRTPDLEPFVKDSGFDTLEEWLKKAKKSRYLFKVSEYFGGPIGL